MANLNPEDYIPEFELDDSNDIAKTITWNTRMDGRYKVYRKPDEGGDAYAVLILMAGQEDPSDEEWEYVGETVCETGRLFIGDKIFTEDRGKK